MKHRRIRVYTRSGTCVHFSKYKLDQAFMLGQVKLERRTGRWVFTDEPSKSLPTPSTLNEQDSFNLAGLNGEKQMKAAQKKVRAWSEIGDTRAVRVGVGQSTREKAKTPTQQTA